MRNRGLSIDPNLPGRLGARPNVIARLARVAPRRGPGLVEADTRLPHAPEPTMSQLTTTQILVLTSACERTDGIAIRPSTLNRSAAVKVAAKLLEHGLMQEQRAKPGWPVWRLDADGKAFSLKILKPGRALAKIVAGRANAASPKTDTMVGLSVAKVAVVNGDAGQSIATGQPKIGTKRTLILTLMQRESGASMADLTAATGWLPHTTRAALTGLRKSGVTIVRSRDAQAASSLYRIEQPAHAAAV